MAQNDLHQVGVAESSRDQVEAWHSDAVLAGLARAQKKSWELLHALQERLEIGMTEADARPWALEQCKTFGVTKHWHRPNIRFGPGSRLSFNDALRSDYHLKPGDLVMIDLGPVWKDEELGLELEGDVGDTMVWRPEVGGQTSEQRRVIQVCRELFRWGQAQAKSFESGRALYAALAQQASAAGVQLLENVEGHRLSDFPHQKYSKARLGELLFTPRPGRWVLEVHVVHPTLPYGAFYEDLV